MQGDVAGFPWPAEKTFAGAWPGLRGRLRFAMAIQAGRQRMFPGGRLMPSLGPGGGVMGPGSFQGFALVLLARRLRPTQTSAVLHDPLLLAWVPTSDPEPIGSGCFSWDCTGLLDGSWFPPGCFGSVGADGLHRA